jgi:hypothetical protein
MPCMHHACRQTTAPLAACMRTCNSTTAAPMRTADAMPHLRAPHASLHSEADAVPHRVLIQRQSKVACASRVDHQ